MFFDDEDEPLALTKRSRLRAMPPIPETGWRRPSYFPDLTNASLIAFDVETREDDFKNGPGWGRNKGHIVGFSVAARNRSGDKGKWYFPVRHEVCTEVNLDPKPCFAWLKAQLETPHIPKTGANLIYDTGWLTTENIFVSGKLHDVQFAEALLTAKAEDRADPVALDSLANKYLREHKTSELLYRWCAEAYGGNPTSGQRDNIHRAPPQIVGHYGEDDADLPIRILEKQWPLMSREGLLPVFELENRLIPLLVKMRLQGVRIDLDYTARFHEELGTDLKRLYSELAYLAGCEVNPNSNQDLTRVFDAHGIKYPRKSPDSKFGSFEKEFLKTCKLPLTDKIIEVREYEKIRGTFVESYLLNSHVNGIVHCQFHPLKGQDEKNSDKGKGAKTGRFASSTPNLQNIPIRTDLGKRVRSAFIPHKGHQKWRKYDYSQIEYRCLAHFAVDGLKSSLTWDRINAFWNNSLSLWGVTGASDALRASYVDDPSTDYHDYVQNNIKILTGILIDRRPIKNINFGLLYGQTEKALAYKGGFTPEQAKEIFAAYHKGAPYALSTMAAIALEVHTQGYITTVAGRRTRFDMWEPAEFGIKGMPVPYREALALYGSNIRRAVAYRGVNYKLQGSAADVIKIAMDAAHTSGVFDFIGYPLLQVHDELDFSVIDESPAQNEAYRFLTHTLENSIKMRIPIMVDNKQGERWGSLD